MSGSFIREALAIEEVRESVRAGLRDRDRLPHFSREEMASIVRAYLTEDQKDAKKNGVHKD